jgi:hypothetical protein
MRSPWLLVCLGSVACAADPDPGPPPVITGLYSVHRTVLTTGTGPIVTPRDYELAISNGHVTMVTDDWSHDALTYERDGNHLVFELIETWHSTAGPVAPPTVTYELDATVSGGLVGRATGVAEISTGPLYTPPNVVDMTFDVEATHE